MNIRFSVVIATHNRASLLGRAIRSALDQCFANFEVIVVDDASSDQTSTLVPRDFPEVRFLRQDVNQGVGAARNRGVREAMNPWVVIFDDDDELLPGALEEMAETLRSTPGTPGYPVLQFATSNGSIPHPYLLITLEHYVTNALRGDFVPVINRTRFIEAGFSYPESRTGGEHLLWWRIAQTYGIPTWNQKVVVVHNDARIRLSSVESQIRLAKDHAELQERTLAEYGEVLKTEYPAFYRTKRLGAAAYWLLIGDRKKARVHLTTALRCSVSPELVVLFGLSFFPRDFVCWIFAVYRKRRRTN